MEKGFYYLAVPYQGTEEEKKYRTQLSLKATTAFLRQNFCLFPPLLYVNSVGEAMQMVSLEQRREGLMPYLLEFLRVSKGLVLITIEGWDKSWGVYQELAYCFKNAIPVYKITSEHLDMSLEPLLSNPLSQEELQNLLNQLDQSRD